MGKLVFNQDKITDVQEFLKLCPFDALALEDGKVTVTSACKMCKFCINNGPVGAAVIEEDEIHSLDKSKWKGITVYVDHDEGQIHPVTMELIGKARELADKIGQKVSCLFVGHDIKEAAEELLHYNVDEVFVYDNLHFKHYLPENYTAVFEDYINKTKPCAILIGATVTGRELAPHIAARFDTGLTADCTVLDISEETDLIQIRPAFGGNIMAQIATLHTRPQLATVRYKVMNTPERQKDATGEIIVCDVSDYRLNSKTEILNIKPKEKIKTIENAEILVVAGRGVKAKEDLKLLKDLADALGGELASTRPLVEMGWMDAKNQIGLSGRTVRPRLIITCGVSGAVQFAAGMNNSEYIFAINKDEKAPIFKIANYGIVGDIYEIVPKLIEKIKGAK